MTTQAPVEDDGHSLDPELLARAAAVCRAEKQRSVSLLQRRLRLGYTVARNLLDVIIEQGLDEVA